MNWKSVEEFVGEDERSSRSIYFLLDGHGATERIITIGHKANVFTPRNWDIRILAYTPIANINFLKRCISAKQLLLLVSQSFAGFDKED